ncbi:hypothetical protein [Legionella israelensis]|uniref:Yip1 domain-containing protein n=1 Tax=Legionella israelensis TaxID=454 RepID=A0A0W0VK60_9GAMM|nr:hypothetical protein [Legionella israelensis]KTD20476.1 hypothetical protein Lisr_1721 [Legionella israelensis]QBS10846.1 hypothetical protein E4T55_13960 [Legionella israelensis]SCX86734.1 hypothetical protein SAMN02746069_00494 [Legionella israelensis DSM 19235]STX57823.1 Uncharacterised protein [Legionella israelensis]
MLTKIVRCYWHLCLFRTSPENTPYSFFLMVLTGFLFFILIVFQWQFAAAKPIFSPLITILAGVSLLLSYLIYTYILLKLFSFPKRLVQTITSLWATHFMIHIFAIPLLILMPFLAKTNMQNPFVLLLGTVYLFATVGLSVWQFMITAHIYRHSLNISTMQSLLASVGLLALNILTVSLWR